MSKLRWPIVWRLLAIAALLFVLLVFAEAEVDFVYTGF